MSPRVSVAGGMLAVMPWTQLEISVLVLVATALQAFTSLADLAVAKRDAVQWWEAEDELVAELPRRQRRGTAREIRSWRDPTTHRSIVHLKMTLLSWCLLGAAAATALLESVVELV